ncbi:helix-hairpin-helix domain-containing protein [Staphylococcus devriesei]|uniref:helix-hairpin-helix domain-containing protein n=2 Tax=Staphylococcus devriesei TaxID=586733 RepID=UPI001F21CFB8|nr:helix-hairpin-helix domain-containing protein [Staphylococcus devriesei]WKU13606.1 helix-hairpin-helix domain-containing protein [Staphylococcus devriesei]
MSFLFKSKHEMIMFLKKWQLYIIASIIVISIIFYITLHNSVSQRDEYDSNTIKYSQNKRMKDEYSADNQPNAIDHKKGTSSDDNKTDQQDNQTIYVDLKGAVKKPGVYKMNSASRINDLITKAKLLKDADISQINLSEKLVDQKMIYIPHKNENNSKSESVFNPTNSGVTKSSNPNQSSTNNKVNLNTSSESELLNVPVIGPTKVKEIISYREKTGTFQNVEDLKKIKGIGEKTFEKIKEYFTV